MPTVQKSCSGLIGRALLGFLLLAGKKERKIIERILDIGEQTRVIKVEQIKQMLSRDGIQLLRARLVSEGLEIVGATLPR